MKTNNQNDYLTREKIVLLLSDDEVASVATAETAAELSDADDFIDLNKLELGVQRGPRSRTPMGHVLPKRSVHIDTWTKIVAQLPTHSAP
jgi:hypothetical protein